MDLPLTDSLSTDLRSKLGVTHVNEMHLCHMCWWNACVWHMLVKCMCVACVREVSHAWIRWMCVPKVMGRLTCKEIDKSRPPSRDWRPWLKACHTYMTHYYVWHIHDSLRVGHRWAHSYVCHAVCCTMTYSYNVTHVSHLGRWVGYLSSKSDLCHHRMITCVT